MRPCLDIFERQHGISALDIIERNRRKAANRLKHQRRLAGLTQRELSERSGVSLRMIQAYEQFDQDIAKAEAGSLLNLASVLGCEPAALLN